MSACYRPTRMISFINQGLERFNAVSFLPLYNCLFIILATLLGALFFREFDSFKLQAMIMFPLGIVTAVVVRFPRIPRGYKPLSRRTTFPTDSSLDNSHGKRE